MRYGGQCGAASAIIDNEERPCSLYRAACLRTTRDKVGNLLGLPKADAQSERLARYVPMHQAAFTALRKSFVDLSLLETSQITPLNRPERQSARRPSHLARSDTSCMYRVSLVNHVAPLSLARRGNVERASPATKITTTL